jgi:predicted permease
MHGVASDLRLAARRLCATPLFTVFAVLSLALGVGITTAVYSIVDAIFFRDLGIPESDRIVFVVTPYDGRLLQGSVSRPDFEDLRAAQHSFVSVSASALFSPAVASPSTTELVTAEAVDGQYFSTLGISAAPGRAIQPSDEANGARVVVLSNSLWRSRFAADPAIVGATIRISGQAFEVIGVAPPRFNGVNGMAGNTRIWIPLAAEPSAAPSSRTLGSDRERRRLIVFGRLLPSLTAAAASADLAAIASRLDATFLPRSGGRPVVTWRPWKAKSLAAIAAEDTLVRRCGMTLVALVALVLVVACTNLANLVLARGTITQREFTVRYALGASRWRLIRQQATESALLAAAGAVSAYAVFQLFRVLIDVEFNLPLPMGGRVTLTIHPTLNVAAVGVAAACLLTALVVFGLEPALQLTRTADIRDALAAGSGIGRPRSRRQRTLLRWQVAIAAGFFIVATMFLRYTVQQARHEPGVDLDRLGIATLNVGAQQWDETRVRRTLVRLLNEGNGDPSIEAISASTGMPFGTSDRLGLVLSVPDATSGDHQARGIAATPSIFATLGVPILEGRGFDDRDHAAAAPVAVLSELTARRVFPTVPAVGRQLTIKDGTSRLSTVTVIGVARDTDVGQVLQGSGLFVYLPLAQRYGSQLTVAVRATGTDGSAVKALRQALRRTDPDLAIYALGSGRMMLAGPSMFLEAAGLSAVALGALTLMLAMAGLYGIQSHIVTHRTREIGVRMSCGATVSQIKRMVLRDGYKPVFEGLAIGLFIGVAGRAVVRAYLEVDVSVVDVWMLAVVPIPLLLAAFFACYLPAVRAAAVDPNVALRHL